MGQERKEKGAVVHDDVVKFENDIIGEASQLYSQYTSDANDECVRVLKGLKGEGAVLCCMYRRVVVSPWGTIRFIVGLPPPPHHHPHETSRPQSSTFRVGRSG